jgi:hypothetical protein
MSHAQLIERVGDAIEIAGVALIVLAVVVAIRTFLSWSLALELDGRWPWQRGGAINPVR